MDLESLQHAQKVISKIFDTPTTEFESHARKHCTDGFATTLINTKWNLMKCDTMELKVKSNPKQVAFRCYLNERRFSGTMFFAVSNVSNSRQGKLSGMMLGAEDWKKENGEGKPFSVLSNGKLEQSVPNKGKAFLWKPLERVKMQTKLVLLGEVANSVCYYLVLSPKAHTFESSHHLRIARYETYLLVNGKRVKPSSDYDLYFHVVWVIQAKDLSNAVLVHEFTTLGTRIIENEPLPEFWTNYNGPKKLSKAEFEKYTQDFALDFENMNKELSQRSLLRNQNESDLEYAIRLRDGMCAEVKYNLPRDAENNRKPPSHVWKTKVAQCGTFSTLYACCLRSQGVPVRLNYGENKSFNDMPPWKRGITHVVVEVFIESLGWIPVEPQGGTFGSSDGTFVSWSVDDHEMLKHRYDMMKVRPCTREELETTLMKNFNKFDVDKDGSLDRDEMAKMFELFMGYQNVELNQDQIGLGISMIDKNQDGRIQKCELLDAAKNNPAFRSIFSSSTRVSQSCCHVFAMNSLTDNNPRWLPTHGELHQQLLAKLGKEISKTSGICLQSAELAQVTRFEGQAIVSETAKILKGARKYKPISESPEKKIKQLLQIANPKPKAAPKTQKSAPKKSAPKDAVITERFVVRTELVGWRAKKLLCFGNIGNTPLPIMNPDFFSLLKGSKDPFMIIAGLIDFLLCVWGIILNVFGQWLFFGAMINLGMYSWIGYAVIRILWAHLLCFLVPGLMFLLKYWTLWTVFTENDFLKTKTSFIVLIISCFCSMIFYFLNWIGGLTGGIFTFFICFIFGVKDGKGFPVFVGILDLLMSIHWLFLFLVNVFLLVKLLRSFQKWKKSLKTKDVE